MAAHGEGSGDGGGREGCVSGGMIGTSEYSSSPRQDLLKYISAARARLLTRGETGHSDAEFLRNGNALSGGAGVSGRGGMFSWMRISFKDRKNSTRSSKGTPTPRPSVAVLSDTKLDDSKGTISPYFTLPLFKRRTY